MKIALVHEFLTQYGGAEVVLENLHEMFPTAPVYALVHDPARTEHRFSGWNIKMGFLDSFTKFIPYKWLLPLMPRATENFDFSGFDLVISDSSAFGKGVVTKKPTMHICYCHTPTRYLWQDMDSYVETLPYSNLIKFIMRPFLKHYLKKWDYRAAQKPDHFIANSETVQERIKKYYNRESTVIYPPVDTEFFNGGNGRKGDYYLTGSRLEPYKKIDLVVEAFNELKLPLKVAGTGTELKMLKNLAGPNIEFLGQVDREQLRDLYRGAKAFIFPALEDAGLMVLESLSCGTPVIGLNQGGTVEFVRDGENGVLFENQTAEDVAAAVKMFEGMRFDPDALRKSAWPYDKKEFRRKIIEFIDRATSPASPASTRLGEAGGHLPEGRGRKGRGQIGIPMRIGIDIRALMEGKTTGVEVYLINLLHNLFKVDRENHYILFANSFRSIDLPQFDYPNVEMRTFRYPNKLFNIAQKMLNYPKVDQLLGGLDLFFSPHWRVTALRPNVPLVVTFHDLFFEIMPNFFTWRRRLWHKFMNYRHAARRANKIIAVSENTKRNSVNLYGVPQEKIEVIYSGVNNAPQPPLTLRGGEGELKYFLFLGTFEPRKNLDAVLSAYEQYREQSSQKRPLVLAGSTGWKTNLQIPEKLKRKISIRQNITDAEKADLFNEAFALLFPSFYEGFGFPVLEAAAADVPVISGYGGSLQEIAGGFAMFVNPLRTAQVANAMLRVEEDRDLYENLKLRGLEAVRKFDWKTTATQALNLFQELVTSPQPRLAFSARRAISERAGEREPKAGEVKEIG